MTINARLPFVLLTTTDIIVLWTAELNNSEIWLFDHRCWSYSLAEQHSSVGYIIFDHISQWYFQNLEFFLISLKVWQILVETLNIGLDFTAGVKHFNKYNL